MKINSIFLPFINQHLLLCQTLAVFDNQPDAILALLGWGRLFRIFGKRLICSFDVSPFLAAVLPNETTSEEANDQSCKDYFFSVSLLNKYMNFSGKKREPSTNERRGFPFLYPLSSSSCWRNVRKQFNLLQPQVQKLGRARELFRLRVRRIFSLEIHKFRPGWREVN